MDRLPIRVLSPHFDFLGEIDNYESLLFIRRFFKVGEFEFRININNNTEFLQEDNIILLGNDSKKAGVIRHKEIVLDENGEGAEILLIRGYTLKGVISRRRIVPQIGQGYDRQIGTTEYIMKQFVNNNFVNPTEAGRKMYQLAIAYNLNRGKQDRWRGSFEVVSDKLEEIGEYSNMGWDVCLDTTNKKWVFDVVVGRDLTVNQNTLPPVIFSVDFDNIKGQSYIDSAINYANVAYAGGQGEEENRLIQQIGDAIGFERIETFLDCSSAEDITELIEEGNRGLEEFKKISTFESQVLDYGSFVYGKDWDLGDIVSVQNKKWNLTMDTRIVEVKEIYEQNGFNLELVFGNTVPNPWNKLKKIEQRQILSTTGSGEPGDPGVGIEYTWNGTELGVKREDEATYEYINLVGPQGLKGDKGDHGIQGIQGLDGKPLEFHWNGTQLGVRVEGQPSYQYVNLKGEKGDQGFQGIQGIQGLKGDKGDTGSQGIQGPKGDKGDKPNHQKVGITGIQFQNPNGTWGEVIELDPQVVVRHQERFIATNNQSIFSLTEGYFTKGTNSIDWYLDGIKQTNDSIREITNQQIEIIGGVPENSTVVFDYIEYANVIIGLKGDKGDTGKTGVAGKSIEFQWSGTSLGVRQEGQSSYQDVNLKGVKGDTGLRGETGPRGPKGDKGDIGATGSKGEKPNHRWVTQTQIQFENPNGTWGNIIDLNPDTIFLHQEYFIATNDQETFNLTKGAYRLGTNSVVWYLDGIKQSNDAIQEISPTSIKIKGGVPSGSSIIIEYIEFVNVAIGLKGEKGDTGLQGSKGDKGNTGNSLEFNWNGTQLGVRVEGTTNFTYVNLKGDKGDTGAQGPQGLKGDTGLQGPIGLTGPKGDKGDTGTQGVQGPKGDKGDQGVQGIQGPKGDNPIWHFVNSTGAPSSTLGTIGDWAINTSGQTYEKTSSTVWTARANIRGPQGIQGIQGPKGDTGATGATGTKGDKGDIGPQGMPGKDGTDANVTKQNVTNALGYTPADKAGETFEGKVTLPVGVVSEAPFNIPHGVAPISPVNGDIWTTTSGLLVRLNGVTRTLAHTASWSLMSQAEAEVGIATTARLISAQRLKQAIDKTLASLEIGGGGTKIITSATEPTGLSVGDQWHREY